MICFSFENNVKEEEMVKKNVRLFVTLFEILLFLMRMKLKYIDEVKGITF